MNMSLVINSKKYPYHEKLVNLFSDQAKEYGSLAVFDMASFEPLHEMYHRIAANKCDLLISFDCAGFEIRTTNDLLAYNKFGCRMAHILFQKMGEYGENLRQQMNFSMFVFSVIQEDVFLIRKDFPNIPNIEWLDAPGGCLSVGQGIPKSNTWISEWFLHIMEEAELLPCHMGSPAV